MWMWKGKAPKNKVRFRVGRWSAAKIHNNCNQVWFWIVYARSQNKSREKNESSKLCLAVEKSLASRLVWWRYLSCNRCAHYLNNGQAFFQAAFQCPLEWHRWLCQSRKIFSSLKSLFPLVCICLVYEDNDHFTDRRIFIRAIWLLYFMVSFCRLFLCFFLYISGTWYVKTHGKWQTRRSSFHREGIQPNDCESVQCFHQKINMFIVESHGQNEPIIRILFLEQQLRQWNGQSKQWTSKR